MMVPTAPWPQDTAPDPAKQEDAVRLPFLAGFGLDVLEDDDELQRIVRFAAKLCDAPTSTVSIVEERRQWFLARDGIEERETDRSVSFCGHAMLGDTIMVVPDAKEDPRFADNALVTGPPKIRFYAGAPLITSEGAPVGALCIFDSAPRPDGLTEIQEEGLKVLRDAVMRRLHARRRDLVRDAELQRSQEKLGALADSIPDIAWAANAEGDIDFFNQRWYEYTGLDPSTPPDNETSRSVFHPDDQEAYVDAWDEALASGQHFEQEFRVRRSDGTWRWMIGRGVPVHDSAGDVTQWFGTLTDIDDGHRLSESRDLLARELSHRIKNIFAVVSGLVLLRARNRPELKDFAEELGEAIRALGRAHDFVRPLGSEKGNELRGLLNVLMAPYGIGEGKQVEVSGVTVKLGKRAATPLALIFHELATNSAKYGALSREEGRVTISLAERGDTVLIDWNETGAPGGKVPERSGFGSTLLDMSVKSQLDGSMEREWGKDGLKVRLSIPAKSLAV
ncbi:PAS domain-containing protein [Erythrobacteraceae bacterium WH01K]|nr:PAS domain-containing protein [Erythrobacteraceae bacterium WH01K]